MLAIWPKKLGISADIKIYDFEVTITDNKSPCLGGPDIHIIPRICSVPTPNKHALTWILVC